MATIDDLLSALRCWHEADTTLRAAVADCEEDADYFCRDKYDREREAAADLGTALERFIQRAVMAAPAGRDEA